MNSDFTTVIYEEENQTCNVENPLLRRLPNIFSLFTRLPRITRPIKSRSVSTEDFSTSNDVETQSMISSDSYSIDSAIFHDDKQQYLSMQTDLIKLDRINSYLDRFRIKDFSEINEFFQDIFIRAPFQYDNSITGFSHNVGCSPPTSPTEETFFNYFDVVRFQNLVKNKPYFDDFATFPTQYLEYSSYYLQTHSKKYDFLNTIQRSGTPFFFINDRHRTMSFSEKKSVFSDLFGYFLVSIGAVSLFAYTFK